MLKRIQTVEFTVSADKIRGQGRPRYSRWSVRKADEDIEWENLIARCFTESADAYDLAGFADEVHITIKVRRRLPKGTPKKLLSKPDLSTPDVDNIAKSVLDALSGIGYKDDSQVTKLSCEKYPRVHADTSIMEVTVNYYANIMER